MGGPVLLVWSEQLLSYDHGATHPMAPGRLEFTMAPERWLDLVHRRTGREGPKRLTDDVEPAYRAWDAGEGDPDDPVDRAIAATRRSVFPDHGLDHIDPR